MLHDMLNLRQRLELATTEHGLSDDPVLDARVSKMKWVICPVCKGDGCVENPAFLNGFTSSEWDEMDSDQQSTYMSGGYDVACASCGGTGKRHVPDVASLPYSERRQLALARREFREAHDFDRQIRAEIAAERRMGC